MTELDIRQARADDASGCARVFFDAFHAVGTRHGFPIDPASRESADSQMQSMLATEGITGLLALRDGMIIGSAFTDERGPIVGVGPVTVEPSLQDVGVGRALMQAVLDRERQRGVAGVRLVQAAYYCQSLALYVKLGFITREPISVFQGDPLQGSTSCRRIRPAAGAADLDACNAVCRRVHGHDRSAELAKSIDLGSARVVEVGGRITGYATGFGYGCHAVGDGNEDVIGLLESAEMFLGLGVLVPSRNAGLMRWCLDSRLRLVQQSTLMTIGLYNEPQGAWLPSILY